MNDLIQALRKHASHTQQGSAPRGIWLSEQLVADLERVVAFYAADEQRHFEEAGCPDDSATPHICEALNNLERAVTSQCPVPWVVYKRDVPVEEALAKRTSLVYAASFPEACMQAWLQFKESDEFGFTLREVESFEVI